MTTVPEERNRRTLDLLALCVTAFIVAPLIAFGLERWVGAGLTTSQYDCDQGQHGGLALVGFAIAVLIAPLLVFVVARVVRTNEWLKYLMTTAALLAVLAVGLADLLWWSASSCTT